MTGLDERSDPDAPLLITPVIPGTTTFDPKPFDGQAIILRVHQPPAVLPIDKSGHVMDGGMDLFDPRQPYWHGKTPELRWPL